MEVDMSNETARNRKFQKASKYPHQTAPETTDNSKKALSQSYQTALQPDDNSSKTLHHPHENMSENTDNFQKVSIQSEQADSEKVAASDFSKKTSTDEVEDVTLKREYEENYLAECIRVIKKNIGIYEEETQRMSAEIKDMYERYRDDDPEIFTELSNTITMNENMKLALSKNMRALKKPYFGRIDITELDGSGGLPTRSQETFYLGKGGVMKDTTHIMVVDWRAPIANVYYENGLGECSYTAPKGRTYTIDLRRKRTY